MIHPRAPIRRFDIFAEYHRVERMGQGFYNQVFAPAIRQAWKP